MSEGAAPIGGESEGGAPEGTASQGGGEPLLPPAPDGGSSGEPAPEPIPPAAVPGTWRDTIRDVDLRNHPHLSKFDSVEALARDNVTMLPLVGLEKLPKPPEDEADWNEEQWNLHYQSLGRPENVEGYEIDFADIPDGMNWDKGMQEEMVGELYKAGLTKRQAQHVARKFVDMEVSRFESLSKHVESYRESARSELQREWGQAYESKIALAHSALHKLAGGEAGKGLQETQLADGTFLGDNPAFIRVLANLGEVAREDVFVDTGASKRQFAMTPDEAKSEIAKFEKKYHDAIFDATDPEHKWALEQRNNLYSMAYPEEKEG